MLYVDGGRRKQVVSFEYDDEWLNDLTNNVTLAPDLRMFKGRQYAPTDKLLFGVFEDSCPDKVDFLIGVYDETRMGGLRFSTSKGGPFVSDDKELATPPWTTLDGNTIAIVYIFFNKWITTTQVVITIHSPFD